MTQKIGIHEALQFEVHRIDLSPDGSPYEGVWFKASQLEVIEFTEADLKREIL